MLLVATGGGAEAVHSTRPPPVNRGLRDQEPDIVEVRTHTYMNNHMYRTLL